MDNNEFKRYVLQGINYNDYVEFFCKEFTSCFKRKAINEILASMQLEVKS